MAVAEPYIAPPVAPRGFRASSRQYLVGMTVPSSRGPRRGRGHVLRRDLRRLPRPVQPDGAGGRPADASGRRLPPRHRHVGRDLLSRVLVGMSPAGGGRWSWSPPAWSSAEASASSPGRRGASSTAVLMRITDVFLALPGPILAIALVAAMGPSYGHTLFGVAIVWWPLYTRIVRAEVRKLRASPHLEAARIAGAGRVRQSCGTCCRGPSPPPSSPPASTSRAGADAVRAVVPGAWGAAPARAGAMTAQGMTYIFEFWWIPIFPAVAWSDRHRQPTSRATPYATASATADQAADQADQEAERVGRSWQPTLGIWWSPTSSTAGRQAARQLQPSMT